MAGILYLQILSDYNESYEASFEDAHAVMQEAILFVQRIGTYLQSKGIDIAQLQ